MSTTRSQKRRNDQQSTSENVSEGLISPIVVGNPCSLNQDDEVAGPSNSKSPRIENSLLESLRASLKEEITSEIKNLLVESQKEMLKLLKPETRGSIRENTEEEVEEETRNFYTPTKSVRISSTQNDSLACRNSYHVMRTCDQSLFSREKINFSFDTVSSLLSCFHANLKSYGAAPRFVYSIHFFISIPALLQQYVPISLLCPDSLCVVLEE